MKLSHGLKHYHQIFYHQEKLQLGQLRKLIIISQQDILKLMQKLKIYLVLILMVPMVVVVIK